MKKVILFLLVAISACKYNDIPATDCDVRDPANDLPWLKEEIQNLEKSSIREYFRIEKVEYNGEVGFFIRDCCPMCSTIPTFLRCSGEAVTDIDASKLIPKGVIWKPANYSCQMN